VAPRLSYRGYIGGRQIVLEGTTDTHVTTGNQLKTGIVGPMHGEEKGNGSGV